MFWPLVAGVIGALIGRQVGRTEGIATALLPVANDPLLQGQYEASLNASHPLSPEELARFRAVLAAARRYAEYLEASPPPWGEPPLRRSAMLTR